MNKNTMKSEIAKTFGFKYRDIKIESWDGGHGYIFVVDRVRYQGDTESKQYNMIEYLF